MRRALPLIAALALLLVPARTSSAQTITLAGDMLKDWQQQKALIAAISDAMPSLVAG